MSYMHDFLLSVEPVMPPYVLTTRDWELTLGRAKRLDPTSDTVCRRLLQDWFFDVLLKELSGRATKRRVSAEWKALRVSRAAVRGLMNKTTHLHWCAKALVAGDLPTALQQGCLELSHNHRGNYQAAYRDVEFLKNMRSIMRRGQFAHVQTEMFPHDPATLNPPD